ncbi:MAG: elongation factor Ts, partial [Anaerolineae bacterium]
MGITTEQVKELRARTGAGVLETKNALVETDGDVDAAVELLRERGLAKAAKKAS